VLKPVNMHTKEQSLIFYQSHWCHFH